MREIIYVFIAAHVLQGLGLTKGYKTFSMTDLCQQSNPYEITLSSMKWNSSGILISDHEHPFDPDLHCMVTLKPPISYGIVISIRIIDLLPYKFKDAECQNYLEISSFKGYGRGGRDTVRLCGYSDDEYEFKSFTHWGKTNIVFHVSNSSHNHKAAFQLTFTAIRKGNNWCLKDEVRCHEGHCIWKGLACDGHNNCGDLSDELDKYVYQCGAMTSTESLAVILVTIVGSLILLIIAAYVRGPKISQQIERMSQCRRTACPQTNLSETDESDGNTVVPTVSRLRANYGSTGGLLSSYDYSDEVPHDPPPRYDEIANLPVVSVENSVIVTPPVVSSNAP